MVHGKRAQAIMMLRSAGAAFRYVPGVQMMYADAISRWKEGSLEEVLRKELINADLGVKAVAVWGNYMKDYLPRQINQQPRCIRCKYDGKGKEPNDCGEKQMMLEAIKRKKMQNKDKLVLGKWIEEMHPEESHVTDEMVVEIIRLKLDVERRKVMILRNDIREVLEIVTKSRRRKTRGNPSGGNSISKMILITLTILTICMEGSDAIRYHYGTDSPYPVEEITGRYAKCFVKIQSTLYEDEAISVSSNEADLNKVRILSNHGNQKYRNKTNQRRSIEDDKQFRNCKFEVR